MKTKIKDLLIKTLIQAQMIKKQSAIRRQEYLLLFFNK